MTVQELYQNLDSAIKLGCGNYDIIFMKDEKYPHSVESFSLDHAGTTFDLLPYQDD